jgi:hypothetical protein
MGLVAVATVDTTASVSFVPDERAHIFEAAEAPLTKVLSVGPENASAHICRGILQVRTNPRAFTAYDPIDKWTVGKGFNRASAQAAAAFLDKIVADMPFPVKAIQVDGGSELMAEFEVACQTKGIVLYVPPPRSRQMNSAVERRNGA